MSLAVGIIGAARVATYAMIAPAKARSDVVVAAVAARDPQRAAAYAAAHGIARSFGNYAQMVADPDIDAVYVATPPAFHLEHARLAIRASKPVLVEKPFTLNTAEAAALLADADAAGVLVVEAMHSRHHPCWAAVQALLPRIGRITHIDAVFDVAVSTAADEFRWDAALGGGALMDLGVYPLAWVRTIAGEPIAVSRAELARERGADARFAAHLVLPGGITAHVAADMTGARQARLTIIGSAGSIIVQNPMSVREGEDILLITSAGLERHPVAGPATFSAQLAAFITHLSGKAPWPLPADDPLRSMQAIDLVRSAA
ncbi:Gfo/Idh/MocA family oxidoreductase [Sandarakinorhabdus sp.]|uniref:Gfo/Idh/MocA family protein n=1 Tax=Sandarakinorhabdus sp. TaxID=1916663 RepID=UPI003340ED33